MVSFIAEAGATCADQPTTPAIDVAALSVGRPDGIYYAGKRLTPWMTFEERIELSRLEPRYTRQEPGARARYVELRKRRAEESLVVRWEVENGHASAPVPLQDMHRETEVHGEGATVARAFIWGPEPGHVDAYDLGHHLLNDVLSGGGARPYGRSTNAYIDEVMRPLNDAGDTWVLARVNILRIIFEMDVFLARQKIERLVEEAREAGIDLITGGSAR